MSSKVVFEEKTQLLGLWHRVNILSPLVENLRWKLSADRMKIQHCLYYITTNPYLEERMLEKYFKFCVKILNNLENEHKGCPITITEKN